MTKSKKSIVMHGMLLCPLVLGHCAFLRANGSDYRTSVSYTHLDVYKRQSILRACFARSTLSVSDFTRSNNLLASSNISFAAVLSSTNGL